MLSAQERLDARQFNQRARQLFWRGIIPDTHPVYHLDDDSIIDWVLDYQSKNQLLCDGRFGPATLITFLANSLGGIGGFIIDGQEIHVEGVRVARMFTPHDGNKVQPDLCCLLSVPEIDYATRDRVNGRAAVRAHFSIDSSVGSNNQSTIIQWADPMREVPFCPTFETVDYPRKRQCVGIELENVLLLYQLDSDERRWLKRRPIVKAPIGNRIINQPVFYDAQIRALTCLLDVLEKHVGIPKVFPVENGAYQTAPLDSVDNFSGCLAKFHYFQMNNEPGAGLVPHLESIFGTLTYTPAADSNAPNTPANAQAPVDAPKLIDMSRFDEKKAELKNTPTPTSSFIPTHEDGPRFSLSNAIAAAYASGKAARAGRIADKCKKFDDA